MPDLLSTSLTALNAFQRAIDLTGHNIANANTPGYSRQVPLFTAREGQGVGSNIIGNGTQITSIRRIYDQALVDQLNTSTSGQARFDALSTLAGRMDSLLADPTTGLNVGLQDFFNAVQDLANDPSSIPARQAVLGEADGLIQRFRGLDQRLRETEQELNQRIEQGVADINRLAASLADVNQRIVLAQGRTAAPPNDLLDERDGIIRDLAGLISVSTALQDDGSLNVFVGTGQSLVVGGVAQELTAQGSEFDPTRLQVAYRGLSGTSPLDNSLTGGALGGLLEFRTRLLDTTRQSLGQTATALAGQFNNQHRSGVDLRGAAGDDFFSIASPTVLYSNQNTGSGSVSAAVGDLGALTGEDYVLSFDGTNYALSRATTGEAVALSGTGSAGDPLVAEGLEIVVSAAPAAGDRVLIRAATDVPQSLGLSITDPQSLALAAPTRSSASINNLGDATISPATVVDPSDPSLLTTTVIEFTDATTYTLNGAGSFTYTPGAPITVNGSQVTLSGSPLAGDRFSIEANGDASGDNANGLLLADVQAVGILDGGAISVNQNYGQLVAEVGGATRQLQANLDAQNVVLANSEEAVLARSGVNLDEEAANLIRFQQAYQAAAQIVSVTNTLFDTLVAATRR